MKLIVYKLLEYDIVPEMSDRIKCHINSNTKLTHELYMVAVTDIIAEMSDCVEGSDNAEGGTHAWTVNIGPGWYYIVV
jgi:hypothetical protein